MLLDADGHVNFGVLGVLLDMGSSGAFAGEEFSPWVHADITVHRLRPPAGGMVATARMLRRGKRTGVVELDVHDDDGALRGGQHPADHLPRTAARAGLRHERPPRRLPVDVRRRAAT